MEKHLLAGLMVVAAGLGLAGCDKSSVPGPAYYLTADELAWQGYQQGQVLRFGRAGSSRVRTYLISEISDRMEEQYQSVWIASVQGQPATFQHISVKGYRTDSVIYQVSITNQKDSTRITDIFLDLHKYQPRTNATPATIVLQADMRWDRWFGSYLPLEEVLANQALPVGGSVALLNSVQFGGVFYGPTLLITQHYSGYLTPRQRVFSRVWYTRGKGVVAYEEVGTGLWYRIP